jgi:hypothetical protein
MGGACGTLRVGTHMHTEFCCGNLCSLNDIGDDDRIILKQILKIEDGKDLNEFHLAQDRENSHAVANTKMNL